MPETPGCLGVNAHSFVPKRQTTINAASNKGQYVDISELYCQKCGQVMLLTGREAEPQLVIPGRRPS